jgi:hypothetical protein
MVKNDNPNPEMVEIFKYILKSEVDKILTKRREIINLKPKEVNLIKYVIIKFKFKYDLLNILIKVMHLK